jgi:hypothetical protein
VGEGYFILAVTPPPGGAWGVRGTAVTKAVPIAFVAGLNLVSFPFTGPIAFDTVSLAESAAAKGGQVAQVIRWEPGAQRFVLWSASSPDANVFPIDERSGYFVLVTHPTAQPFELVAGFGP